MDSYAAIIQRLRPFRALVTLNVIQMERIDYLKILYVKSF
jgi:hypothetical protein